MSWLTSYCPRCQGMLIVPATFAGHSIICDKCGVTFVAMAQPQYMVPPQSLAPPMQLPPQSPYPATLPPMTYGYGAPPYSSPAGYGAGAGNAPPASTPLGMPPSSSYETGPSPGNVGGSRSAPHPFGNPLPEIEILPPPQAKRRSSRKRSGDGKRSRKRLSPEHAARMAPPPLPTSASSRMEERVASSAAALADHGPSVELGEIEQRIRRAQLRRTLSLAFAVVGLLAMTVVGLLVIKFVKPGTPKSDVPAAAPEESAPVESAPSDAAEATEGRTN